MSFIETPRFPDGIAMDFSGGPRFSTDIVVNAGSYESRNRNWSQARGRWTCSQVPKSRSDTETLIAFFRNAAGRANGFRFKDWSDYNATSATGVFVELTPTTFQMYKRYTTGSTTHDRKITKPSGTITVTGGTTPSVASTTGIVTVAAGTPTAWAGDFDVPARFDSDEMIARLVETNPHMFHWGDIAIVELRDE